MITPSEKHFEYENNGIKGKIILILETSEKIKIKILQNDIHFESIFNLKNLKKKNKYFQVCTITEIYEFISKYIENKNYTLENTANGITLKISTEVFFSTIEVEFEIINEKLNKNDLIQKLLNEKKDIRTQLNMIQVEQREIKETINKILEKLDKLVNNQNTIEKKEINEIHMTENDVNDKNNEDFENVMKSSKIVDKTGNQINHIKNWICPNKKLKCKLLYDGKRDGGQTTTFHSLCDNKGPTITFIKTNKNRRIGGFTMKNWNVNLNSYVSDDKAFIFDLDKNEKYEINSASNAIYSHKGYGPIFGGNHDILLGENFFTDEKNSYFCHNNNSYYKYSSNVKDKSQVNFICEEIEVYQIIFDN